MHIFPLTVPMNPPLLLSVSQCNLSHISISAIYRVFVASLSSLIISAVYCKVFPALFYLRVFSYAAMCLTSQGHCSFFKFFKIILCILKYNIFHSSWGPRAHRCHSWCIPIKRWSLITSVCVCVCGENRAWKIQQLNLLHIPSPFLSIYLSFRVEISLSGKVNRETALESADWTNFERAHSHRKLVMQRSHRDCTVSSYCRALQLVKLEQLFLSCVVLKEPERQVNSTFIRKFFIKTFASHLFWLRWTAKHFFVLNISTLMLSKSVRISGFKTSLIIYVSCHKHVGHIKA